MHTQAQTREDRLVTLIEAVEDYLLICRVSKAPKSAERAEYSLKKLLAWCNERGITTLHRLTRKELLLWSLSLQQEPLSKQTLWTYTSTVKAFLRWCAEERLLPESPLKRGDFPSKPRPAPQPLTVGELKAVLEHVDGPGWLAKRNVAMLTVLLHSGCRRGELLQMRVGDVERGFSLVTQKGGRQHVVHLSSDCVKAIQNYLRALRLQRGVRLDAEDSLWLSRTGEPLTGNAVRLVFRNLSKQTGLRLYAHRMRHTSATLRLVNGASTEVVRLALGHSDVRSIQSYVKLAQVDASRLLEETSPVKLLRGAKSR